MRRRTRRGCSSPSLTVTAPDGEAAVFRPLSDPVEDPSVLGGKDFEDRHLALLFRDSLEHASGRNVAVGAEVRRGSGGRGGWPRPGCRLMTCRRRLRPG